MIKSVMCKTVSSMIVIFSGVALPTRILQYVYSYCSSMTYFHSIPFDTAGCFDGPVTVSSTSCMP